VAYTIRGRSGLVLEASRKRRQCHAINDAYVLITLMI